MSLRISGKQLSLGMDGDDVAQVHAALRALGRAIPVDELSRRVFGPQTAAMVRALQLELGVEGTSVLDERTVTAINGALEGAGTGERVVRGRVVDENGRRFHGGSVSVALRRPGVEMVLAKERIGEDGTYDLRFEVPREHTGVIDLRVVVADESGPVETVPSGASLIADAGMLEVVDFVVAPRPGRARSELEATLADLAPLLAGRDPAELHEGDGKHDVSLLATQSGYSTAQIAALVRAHQLARETGKPAAMFYGLVRGGFPAALEALLATEPGRRKATLAAAVADGLVPEQLDGRPIHSFLSELSPVSTGAELVDLFGDRLGAPERAAFMATYFQHAGDPDAFWTAIRSDPRLRDRADQLQLAVQLGALTNLHVPLVNALLASGHVREARDVVRFADEEWRALVDASGGAPDGTPGATPEARVATYVGQILAQIEAAFPAAFLAARLGETPAARFLAEHPRYDLEKTYPDRFVRDDATAARALTLEARRELITLQRLYRVTGRATETIALAARGVHSAVQIARLDRDVFAARVAESLPAMRAHQIHAAAERVAATATAVFGEYATKLDRTTLRALPRIDSAKRAELAAAAIPNWESLFGAFDLCACEECASAHGPAAYLVDVLQFLDERGVKDALFARRPDLGEIELSCENTNTLVPTIDLVNEILEDVVAPLPAFAPFALPPPRVHDLVAGTVTAELSAAFAPALTTGARIESLEAHVQWRVCDEAYEYTVAKTASSLDVTTRSRQTSGGSAVRRAAPQYVNRAAYRELRDAVYPWTLPFDLPGAEGSVLLAHLGVARGALIAALRGTDHDDPVSPVRVVIAAEGLGLSDVQRAIIVGAPLTTPRSLADFWGGSVPAASATVRDVLDRSGLSFEELADLVTTDFVDPTHHARIRARAGERIDTCDPTRLELSGLTPDVLDRAHRFVRLQRAVGWSIRDVDRALAALTATPATPVLDDEFLVRLEHVRTLARTLRVSIAEALSLWAPIDTSDADSLYRRLFLDPLAPGSRVAAFALRADGTELARAGELASAHGEALQAVLGLSPAELAILVLPEDRFTLSTLSRVHRHVVIARALGLSIGELSVAIELTGLAPFDRQRPGDAGRLAEVVAAMRAAGFSIAQLDYLLRHRASAASTLVPSIAESLQTLEELRQSLQSAAPASSPQTIVHDRIAAALETTTGTAAGLLERIHHSAQTAEHWLGELVHIEGSLSVANATIQLEVFEAARKAAVIVEALELPDGQLAWLFRENPWLAAAPASPTSVVPFASWSSLLDLVALRRELALEPAALDAILSSLTSLATAADADLLAARNALILVLGQWLGWSRTELEALLGAADDASDRGLLGAHLPEDYRVGLLVRVARAIALLSRLGVGARAANAWCNAALTMADAIAIRDASKAKHDRDEWLRVAPALQDELRDRQRAALVDYLVARPAAWGASSPSPSARDLFAHFLVDVEMTACQQTSRIKQAIGSVQLFAQRALLGLEPNVSTIDARWEQWEWMKSFRLWEANQKIWLYPENYIEPELRDNKTPEFRELEEELQQTELDDEAAEPALRHYLEKLDELARLEVAGVYEDEDRILHVFGRTDHAPRRLFYRRRARSRWTAWERVPLEVEGEHLIPVKWNRRLMLIWPVFAEKTFRKRVVSPLPGGTFDDPDRYWEIRLAWAEYQHGSWAGPNLSEPVSLVAYQDESEILFGERRERPGFVASSGVSFRPSGPLVGTDPGTRPPPGPSSPPPQGIPGTGAGPRKLVSTELFVFKALAQGSMLNVRGYLRRDYRGQTSSTDREIACVFGEFRFEGCRKIVSSAHVGQITRRNLALAPTGTKFDHMWFTQTGTSLVAFDGTFPTLWDPPPEALRPDENLPSSIAGDPAPVFENKLDIPVLDRAPSAFRILAPHQDLQFVCDRPFFYTDRERGFIVTSTGHTERIGRPELGEWVSGEVGAMARERFFGSPPPRPVDAVATPLSLLVADGNGGRVVKELPPVNLRPAFRPRTLFPFFSTSRRYRFESFTHPYACRFVETLDEHGIRGLLSLETQNLSDPQSFDAYAPTTRVDEPYPSDLVELDAGGAFEVYNWELFFHIPLLIAERLRANQRFADAQRWFHYIFDPTGSSTGDAPQRYWRTKPFHDRLAADYEAQSAKALEELIARGPTPALRAAIQAWRESPFSPHAIARLRTTAYQKTVVMKYLDNLIAWGDQLFARDTLESINEATQLYALAAEVLGREPEIIDRHLVPAAATFNSLAVAPGGLANALEQIELLVGATDVPANDDAATGDSTGNAALVFCVPENSKLLGYWTTVADRLFKIRTCRNIAGQVRQLPLFEPPIDPALLVRARAAGLDLGDIIGDTAPGLPAYRFSATLQRASELAADVRNLGMALLSVLEKRDAEALATLRSGQEVKLLQAVRDVRERQIDEAKVNLAALEQARASAQARATFYETREIGRKERTSLSQLRRSYPFLATSAGLRAVASGLHLLGVVKFGAPTTAGDVVGPASIGDKLVDAANVAEVGATLLNAQSRVAATEGELERRKDDWKLQAELAEIELRQIEQQTVANEIRLAIAENELRNHERQLEQARDVDRMLRSKFSSQDLYQFSISQLSGLHFQAYQLACELAKRAERCMQHELGLEYGSTSHIGVGSWDSLRQGLWAGEHLAHDLRRLELAYADGNTREYELTKHVSLDGIAPEQLLMLKTTGACELSIPEWIFDLDTPGHVMRRIKSVALTLPCVTGPFTSVHCKLTLLASSYRRTDDLAGGYTRVDPDARFVDGRKTTDAIVTSTGQNDAGLFELNLRDERYLPFEGAGAISSWRLELPTALKTFDHSTISDVVLHLRYTARDGGEAVRAAATSEVARLFGDAQAHPLARMFSLRHDFPSEWQKLATDPSPVRSVTVDLAASRFPFFTRDRTIHVRSAEVTVSAADPAAAAIRPGPTPPDVGTGPWSGSHEPGPWTIVTNADPTQVDDIWIVLSYTLTV